jgi:hypothetical protein
LHASHSFCIGIVGLLLCVETVKSVMIATICGRKWDNTLHQQGHRVRRCTYVTHLGEVDYQCPDNRHELFARSVIAAVTEKHENTARDGESRWSLISRGAGRQNCHRSVRPRNDGISNSGSRKGSSEMPLSGRLQSAVGRCTGGGERRSTEGVFWHGGSAQGFE